MGKTIAEQEDFYNEFWKTRPREINLHEAYRLSSIISMMQDVKENFPGHTSLRICDVGCGTGWLANCLSVFGSVTGIDLSQEAIEIARLRWPHINFYSNDIMTLVDRQEFDVIVCSEVIEHIENKNNFVELVSRLLTDDGFIVLSCPNSDIQKYFGSDLPSQQPIELWPTREELQALFLSNFVVMQHFTKMPIVPRSPAFMQKSHKYRYHWRIRIIQSHKVNKVIDRFGLRSQWIDRLSKSGYGLYQFILAKKR